MREPGGAEALRGEGRLMGRPAIEKLLNSSWLSDERVRAAIEEGMLRGDIHPGDRGVSGETPLHWAVRAGRPSLIGWLAEATGAEVNERGRVSGESALDVACQGEFGQLDPAREAAALELLRLGADPKSVDSKGRSALHWAAQSGALRVCEALVRGGAAMGEGGDGGPWLRAARSSARGSVESGPWSPSRAGESAQIMDGLLALGARIEEEGGRGSALCSSAETLAPLELGLFLLSRGADPNQRRAGDLFTPLRALLARSGEMVRVGGSHMEEMEARWASALLEAGADPRIKDAAGWSPADEAMADDGVRRAVLAWMERKELADQTAARPARGGRASGI